jgi:cytochrome P450
VQAIKAQLDELIYTLIDERKMARARAQHFDDILEMLLEVQEHDQTLNDQHIRDELLTIFAAGHETTAYALSWAFYALASHQTIQKTLQTELDSVLGKRKLSQEALGQLPYNSAVFKETLRLYPTIPSAPRVTLEQTQLAGFDIPKGSRVLVSIYAIQRHPEFWSEPERFKPERFEQDPRHSYVYLPFGLGERFCLGHNLALLQGQLVLAQLARACHFQPPEQVITPGLAISLFPRANLSLPISLR